MPSQPSSPSAPSTGSVRLAHVFVRIPSDNRQGAKPATAVRGQEMNKLDRSQMSSASEHQHALLQTSKSQQEEEEPCTPQKQPATKPTFSSQLPPTPSPTPTKKNPLKRALHHHHHHHHPSPQTSPPLKRHRTNNTTPSHSTLPHFHRPPKFSLAYAHAHHHHHHHSAPPTSSSTSSNKPPNRQTGISWQELKRCAESVMRQVDWEEVVTDVAGNRSKGVYKKAVRGLLQEGIEEIVRLEGGGGGRGLRRGLGLVDE